MGSNNKIQQREVIECLKKYNPNLYSGIMNQTMSKISVQSINDAAYSIAQASYSKMKRANDKVTEKLIGVLKSNQFGLGPKEQFYIHAQ